MADLWMPQAVRADTGRRLSMNGTGERLFTHHTFEAVYSLTLTSAMSILNRAKSDPHLVFNPVTGALGQMLPANTGGRTLVASGTSTNTFGSIHLQVETIGYAKRPWNLDLTAAGLKSLGHILEFCEDWGVPTGWANGSRPRGTPSTIVKAMPTTGKSGHTSHGAWRGGNHHWDPGAIADPWALVSGVNPTAPDTLVDRLTAAEVRDIQSNLNDAFGADLDVDGKFGPLTIKAVQEYQKASGLEIDGVPGPNTNASLRSDMATLKTLSADIAAIPGKVWSGTTVTLSNSAQAALNTGIAKWTPEKLVSTLAHRVGYVFLRTADLKADLASIEVRVDGIAEAIGKVQPAPGVTQEDIEQVLRDSIEKAIGTRDIVLAADRKAGLEAQEADK